MGRGLARSSLLRRHINLNQSLAGFIADLEKDRERLRAALLRDEQKAEGMGENW